MQEDKSDGLAVEHHESLAQRAMHAISNGVNALIDSELEMNKQDLLAAMKDVKHPLVALPGRETNGEVTVVLLTNHTHCGKKLLAGAEITTYPQQARWLVLMRIAEVKTTTKE